MRGQVHGAPGLQDGAGSCMSPQRTLLVMWLYLCCLEDRLKSVWFWNNLAILVGKGARKKSLE